MDNRASKCRGDVIDELMAAYRESFEPPEEDEQAVRVQVELSPLLCAGCARRTPRLRSCRPSCCAPREAGSRPVPAEGATSGVDSIASISCAYSAPASVSEDSRRPAQTAKSYVTGASLPLEVTPSDLARHLTIRSSVITADSGHEDRPSHPSATACVPHDLRRVVR